MAKPSSRDMALARQARLVGVVMAVAIVAWVTLGWLGREFGWDPRYAFLIDFSALAAFGWSLIVTFRIWRHRKADR